MGCRVEMLASEALPDGARIDQYRLSAGPFLLEVMTLGCAITRLYVPDRSGHTRNVVLAHADLSGYLQGREYFGAVVGRLANRLRRGRLRIGGSVHQLSVNDGANHLHGGVNGFDRRIWQVVSARADSQRATIEFERTSAAGEEGYPGRLVARVRYSIQDDGAVEIVLAAAACEPTVVNMTNHSYFNLRGAGEGDVLRHELTLNADRFCAIDEELLPTGNLLEVAGTPFDFLDATRIGARIDAQDVQLQRAGGFDHCMALRPPEAPGSLVRAASVFEPESGRSLEVFTDQPGVQFYSGNFLDGSAVGSDGSRYRRHAGFCLETQKFPDAPNHPDFPSVLLQPGEHYTARTVWRFSAR